MNREKTIKRFQRAAARFALFTFYRIFSRLPYRVVRLMTRLLVFVGFKMIGNHRQVALESLRIAFNEEKDEAEIRAILRKCFQNFGQGMAEMLYFLSHPETVSGRVFFEGQENIDKALEEGNGVVAVTAHFGNFPLMMMRCALAGYKTNAIIRPARDPDIEKFLYEKRLQCGLKTVYAIPRKQCVADSLRVLRNNEILFIPLDQNFGSGRGVFVDFFGQRAATATGPVVFAARTKARIVPMFIIHQKNNTHKIIIEPPFELEEIDDEEKMIQVNIQKITKLIESYIRQYPAEWGWMHRRWKSRPYEMKYMPNA